MWNSRNSGPYGGDEISMRASGKLPVWLVAGGFLVCKLWGGSWGDCGSLWRLGVSSRWYGKIMQIDTGEKMKATCFVPFASGQTWC